MQSYQELEARLNRLEGSVTALQETTNDISDNLQTVSEATATIAVNQTALTTTVGQQNLVRNGNIDHSRNTYLYDTDFSDADPGTIETDVSEEAAYIYSHVKSAAVLYEDTTDIDIDGNQATNTTLKNALHSRYTVLINNPDWDKNNGLIRTGSTNTIDLPLPDKLIKASKSYYVGFLARIVAFVDDGAINAGSNIFDSAGLNAHVSDEGRQLVIAGAGAAGTELVTTIRTFVSPTRVILAADALTSVSSARADFEPRWDTGLQPALNIGLWDNTAGEQQYLQGDTPNLTASTVNNTGLPIATLSTEYFVAAVTSWGELTGTNIVTIDAPAVFDFPNIYVNLYWKAVVGALNYLVYRKSGGIFYLVKEVYPGNSYKDTGSYINTESGYPPAASHPRAFISTTDENFQPTARWQRFIFNVPVPDTYSAANTTGKQWLRIGLDGALTGAGMQRGLQLDEISIDDKNGIFTYNPIDFFIRRNAPIAPTGGSQGTADPSPGGTGTGSAGGNDGTGTSDNGGVYIPPGDGGFCPTFEMLIDVEDRGHRKQVAAIELIDNEHRYKVINRVGIACPYFAAIGRPRIIYRLLTDGGRELTASARQPVFTSPADTRGVILSELKIGDRVLTKDGLEIVIANTRQIRKRHVVKISLFNRNHGYWANDFGLLNRKPSDFELPEQLF